MMRHSLRAPFIGLLGLIVLAAPFALGAEPGESNSLMIWDGDKAAKGKSWASPKDENSLGPSDTAHKGKKSLEFRAKGKGWIGCGWNWFAWWPADAHSDLSGYKEMRFYIRVTGQSLPDDLSILLIGAAMENPPRSVALSISDYTTDKDTAKFTDGKWHEVVIPMKDFVADSATPAFTLKSVWEFNISQWSRANRDFTANFDSIQFTGTPDAPAAPSTATDVAAETPAPAAGDTVAITVNANKGRRPISPYLYGNNNRLPKFVTPEFAREVGLRLTRNSGGNNCTKYNWREQLTSHPDWYNNIHKSPLESRAMKPGTQGDVQVLLGLPVLGWVAKPGGEKYNYNGSAGKPKQNLCANGRTELYLQTWTPKDSVDMVDYLFASPPSGMGQDPKNFRYFHLDNEPEGWATTHDDIYPKSMTGEQCVQKYVAVAKELRRRHPKIKILAPGFMSEWYWWNWGDNKPVDGMPWMQYFVKRMAEESKKANVKLIDVVDFHTYTSRKQNDSQILQEHRILYDPTYEYPYANGCKAFPEGANGNPKVERVFGRMEGWLDEYFGPNHGITLGVTECMPGKQRPPMVQALWYASMLGTFADHGVEIFAPWDWYAPQWEVMHLFSRYGQPLRVQTTSSEEEMVSAYASVTEKNTAMTIFLLNRDPETSHSVRVGISGFTPKPGTQQTLTLTDLPREQTFRSHTDNALKKGAVNVSPDGALGLTLPPYSIVAVVLQGGPGISRGKVVPPKKETFTEGDAPQKVAVKGKRINVFTPYGYDKPENGKRQYPIVVLGKWGESWAFTDEIRQQYPAFFLEYQRASEAHGEALADILDAAVAQGLRIDLNRVYLTGFSAGGSGSYKLVRGFLKKGKLFAAINRVAGQSEAVLPDEAVAGTSIWLHIGTKDNRMRVLVTKNAYTYLKDHTLNKDATETTSSEQVVDVKRATKTLTKDGIEIVKYSVYENMGHNPKPVYKDPEIFRWMFSQSLREQPAPANANGPTDDDRDESQ